MSRWRLFTGTSVDDFRQAHTQSQPSSPSTLVDGIDPAVERILLHCLEKNPSDRPTSVLAVSAALPGGLEEAPLRNALLSEHGIEVGGGLGPAAGKIWRIGLMGHTARPQNVDRLLAALASVLR